MNPQSVFYNHSVCDPVNTDPATAFVYLDYDLAGGNTFFVNTLDYEQ